MNQDDLTRVSLRFTTDLRKRLGKNHTEFVYDGKTVRDLLRAVSQQFEVADLLMAGDKPLPFVQVVINGRLSYTVGGLDSRIPDGATVTLISCCGVLTPVPLPRGTTVREFSEWET
jgi:molybdopterin converting factor small subunit